MTNEEIEKQAEEYVIKTICKTECPVWNIHSGCTIPRKDCHYTSNRLKGYIDSAKWGMEHKWHDLRKDPNDLPKYENSMMIWICWINAYGNKCYRDTFYDSKGFYWVSEKTCYKKYADGVIAWCELPQFKE